MAHHDHKFTEAELTERFDFTARLRTLTFGIMGIGAVILLLGVLVAFFQGEPHEHHGDGHGTEHHEAAPGHDGHDSHDGEYHENIPEHHDGDDDHSPAGDVGTEGTQNEKKGIGVRSESDDATIIRVQDPGAGAGEAEDYEEDYGAENEQFDEAMGGVGQDEGGHAHHHLHWYTGTLAAFLHSNLFFLTLAMGALFFICVHRVGNAGWQTAIKRIPEAMFSYIPYAFVGFLLIAVFGGMLYDWIALPEGQDALIDEKRAYLNIPFWLIRLVVFFGGWYAVAYFMRKYSRQQDEIGSNGLRAWERMMPVSAAFIIFFALSYTLFSIDWIKSLEPHWFSTIFGVYVFAGSMASAMAFMGLIVNFLRSRGYMSYVSDAHVHDIYKYAFGFSIFWGYIFISQYLLIWYANIPEETFYFANRLRDYKFLFFLNIILCFVTPFLGLMTRDAKRKPRVFTMVAALMLIGHWTDLYLMVMPGAVRGTYGHGFFLPEIGMTVLYLGIFLFVVLTALSRANLIPITHPYTDESIHHSTGEV